MTCPGLGCINLRPTGPISLSDQNGVKRNACENGPVSCGGGDLHEIIDDSVSGSVRDWLTKFSFAVVASLGFDRAIELTGRECLQMPFAYVLNPDTPMNSLETQAHIACMNGGACPVFDADGNMIGTK